MSSYLTETLIAFAVECTVKIYEESLKYIVHDITGFYNSGGIYRFPLIEHLHV